MFQRPIRFDFVRATWQPGAAEDRVSKSPMSAWYERDRHGFLDDDEDRVVGQLSACASSADLDTPSDQVEEWRASVSLMHGAGADDEVGRRVRTVRGAVLEVPEIAHVVLEYDFRRRGLRLDAVLLSPGVVFVVEFKRSRLGAADRDQVMSYAVNLLEFHRVTREWAEAGTRIVPILVLTGDAAPPRVPLAPPSFAPAPWSTLLSRPLQCAGATGLRDALRLGLRNSNVALPCDRAVWLASPFAPSSTMIDAALSLYGQHDVSAIEAHAAPKAAIDDATREIAGLITHALAHGEHRLVLLSGAPGAGKTLVGLNLAFRAKDASRTVFVTGNAPLVQVLQTALKASYAEKPGGGLLATGYRHTKDAIGRDVGRLVRGAATFKIVTAHAFLGTRGAAHGQEDGTVVVFDEAQRTYERGREVLRQRLEDHEADLILKAQRSQFPNGSVVVALIGHNQAINRGERGMGAWLEAADRLGWRVSAAATTMSLLPSDHPSTTQVIDPLRFGHLDQSMRFYRNDAMERWAAAVVEDDPGAARAHAAVLGTEGLPIRLTRNLETAKCAVRRAGERSGIIASGQARRLGAHGLFVDHKPDIGAWMLAPSSDFRSSNALETVQNQYQVQGMELDHTVVAWDLDLRRSATGWAAYRLAGASWNSDRAADIAKNSYRVLLTRARKGLVLFVPPGDLSGDDETRPCEAYDAIAAYLTACGAVPIAE